MTLLSLQKNLHSLYVASKEHNKGIFSRLKPGSIPACFYKNFIFAKTVKEITQIISKTKKAVDTEKKIILKSVEQPRLPITDDYFQISF